MGFIYVIECYQWIRHDIYMYRVSLSELNTAQQHCSCIFILSCYKFNGNNNLTVLRVFTVQTYNYLHCYYAALGSEAVKRCNLQTTEIDLILCPRWFLSVNGVEVGHTHYTLQQLNTQSRMLPIHYV